MGTSATIIAKKGDSYHAIYNNYDGYPEYLLKMLQENYQDDNKVQKLVALGDVSYVSEEVDIPEGCDHSYNNPQKSITVAYGRDRGESGTSCRVYKSLDEAMSDEDTQYHYFWDGNGWQDVSREL
jgi:hypothetical protein